MIILFIVRDQPTKRDRSPPLWRSLVIRLHFAPASLVRLGAFEGSLDPLLKAGEIPVRLDVAE